MSPAIISLIILAICIVLFITRVIPSAATAVLGCALLVITGVCDIKDAFSGFSNSTVLLMFGMMVVGIAMQETGIASFIGHKVTKLSKRNERLFIFVAGLTSVILSTFLSNTAVIAIFLPIIESVSKADKKMNRLNLTLPVTLGAMFGGVCTLIGSTPQLTANGILSEMTGEELKMFDYILPGIMLVIGYLLYVELIGPKLAKRIWGNRQVNVVEEQVEQSEDTVKLDKKKAIIVSIIFALTIVSFIGGWISTALTAVIAALLCVITGCVKQKAVIKKMDWSVVFVLAGCLGLAAGITKGGAGDLIGNALSKVLGESIPVFVIFAVFVVATMIISNFITNSTAVVIMLPIAIALCSTRGYNPLTFTLGIVYAANLTYSTPLANAQTAMTLVAGYKFSDYIRYTWPLALITTAGILAFVPLFFPF